MIGSSWYARFTGKDEVRAFRVIREIVNTRSDFQSIQILETSRFGRVLCLDGIPQSSTVDEHIYHETLVRPALECAGTPTSVLVVGGGEGATLREVLTHRGVERAVMIEIDGDLVALTRQHLGMWGGAYADSRGSVVLSEGREFLEQTDEVFDVIILDTTDPTAEGTAAPLFTREAYSAASRALAGGGVLAIQAGRAGLGEHDAHVVHLKTLESVFPTVLPYYAYIPLYGTLYGFAIATHAPRTAAEEAVRRVSSAHSASPRYWDADTARGAFAVPLYIRDLLESSQNPISTDVAPLVVDQDSLGDPGLGDKEGPPS